jgi:hypothetical protein
MYMGFLSFQCFYLFDQCLSKNMYAIVCIYVDSLYTIFIHSFPSLVSKLLIFFFVSDHLLLVAKEFVKS